MVNRWGGGPVRMAVSSVSSNRHYISPNTAVFTVRKKIIRVLVYSLRMKGDAGLVSQRKEKKRKPYKQQVRRAGAWRHGPDLYHDRQYRKHSNSKSVYIVFTDQEIPMESWQSYEICQERTVSGTAGQNGVEFLQREGGACQDRPNWMSWSKAEKFCIAMAVCRMYWCSSIGGLGWYWGR